MKSFALLVVGAGVAIAQSLADLPQCGQTCISNMLSIAQREFSCQPGDAACYCSDARFGLGVRDCANEACSADEAGQVISYGSTYCAALAASGAASSTGALPVLTSALASISATATGELMSTPTGDLASASSAIESAQSSIASGLSSALASLTESAASAASSVLSSAESAASSAAASGSNAASSVAESLSSAVESVTGSVAESATGAPSTPAAGGMAPKMTGLPVAGAAGLVAWLLL